MSQHHHKHAPVAHAGPGKPATVSNTADDTGKLASHDHIRLCAYQKWETAGKPTGDGVQFWLEAEQELVEGKKEKFAHGDGRHGDREQERPEKRLKEGIASADSHYRDNNRMFQSHGERGHR